MCVAGMMSQHEIRMDSLCTVHKHSSPAHNLSSLNIQLHYSSKMSAVSF